MLYIYTYPENHKLGTLNDHLVFFLTQIRNVSPNAKFNAKKYFQANFTKILENSPTLKKKFIAFFNTYKKLTIETKEDFYQRLLFAQNIQSFFTDDSIDCTKIKNDSINLIIGNDTFKDLASYLFKTTLKTGEWDISNHYDIIYKAMPHKICPFCGIEIMHHSFREDYDHLAPKKHYPLVSVHPKNLAPMCHTCNSKNKGDKDVLYKTDGTRKKMVYPYLESVDITFDYSTSIIPQTDITQASGKWLICIVPDNEITKNWDEIFGIKKRYKEDFLVPNFDEWINDFINDCIENNVDISQELLLKAELLRMAKILKKKWYTNLNIIKAPLFEYLSNCNNAIFYNSISLKYNKLRPAA